MFLGRKHPFAVLCEKKMRKSAAGRARLDFAINRTIIRVD
jgi:hypothetical protein